MKNEKIWIVMLILGLCFMISGIMQMFTDNYVMALGQMFLGFVEIILAFIQKMSTKEDS